MEKAILNEVIKTMGALQNKKKKQNAGQLRESALLFIKAVKQLAPEKKLKVIKKL